MIKIILQKEDLIKFKESLDLIEFKNYKKVILTTKKSIIMKVIIL